MITVRIPTALQKFTGNKDILEVEGATVGELIEQMESAHPGIKNRICDETGSLRRFVNVYVDGEDIRFQSNLETAVRDGAEVSIIPSIAGG